MLGDWGYLLPLATTSKATGGVGFTFKTEGFGSVGVWEIRSNEGAVGIGVLGSKLTLKTPNQGPRSDC